MLLLLFGLASLFACIFAVLSFYLSQKNIKGPPRKIIFFKSLKISFLVTVFLSLLAIGIDHYIFPKIPLIGTNMPQPGVSDKIITSGCNMDSQLVCIYIAGFKGNYLYKEEIVDSWIIAKSIKDNIEQIILKSRKSELHLTFSINNILPEITSHIDTHTDARKIGKLLKADIVIWGSFEHHLPILPPKILPNITIINPPLGGPADIELAGLTVHKSNVGELEFYAENIFRPIGLSHLFIGLGYFIKNDFTLAIEQFESGLKQNNGATHLMGEDAFYYFLGNSYLSLYESTIDTTMITKSICSFLTALEIKPNDTYYYNDLGIAYDYAGKFIKSEEVYNKSIQIDPLFLSPLNNLAVVYYEQKKDSQAVYIWNKLLKLDSLNVTSYINLGKYYFFEGRDHLKALIYTKRAASIKSAHRSIAYNNLGAIYISLDSLDLAINCFAWAVKEDPNYAEAFGNLGTYLTYKKRYVSALDNFYKALKINPNLGYIYYCIACVYAYQGKANETITIFEKYFTLLNSPYSQLGNRAPFEALKDDDLIMPIKNTPEYISFISKNSHRFYVSN